MGSIFNFNLKDKKEKGEVIIDLNGVFYYNDKHFISYTEPQNLSPYLVKDDGNGNLFYNNSPVGVISYPDKVSLNLNKIDRQIHIEES